MTALEEGRTHSQGVGDGDVQTYDSFLEPDEYDDHLCRETSVTFGGPRLGRTLGLSRVNSMHNLRGSQLAPESSQGYLARTLVDEGSQASLLVAAVCQARPKSYIGARGCGTIVGVE